MNVVYQVSKQDTENVVKMKYLWSQVRKHLKDDRFTEVTVRRTGH